MHSHLKIALCGAPGAGKTALAKALSRKLTLPLIHQGTKELRELRATFVGKLPPFWRMNEVNRMQYQVNLIEYRMKIEKEYNEFVADGCAIDLLVWYRMAGWLIPFDQKMETLKALTAMTQRYDYVFYLPYYQPPPAPQNEEEELTAVDPFNCLTADFIEKGVVSYLIHSKPSRPVHVIETPPFIVSTSPDVDNVQAAVDKRVEEVLSVVLAKQEPVGPPQ